MLMETKENHICSKYFEEIFSIHDIFRSLMLMLVPVAKLLKLQSFYYYDYCYNYFVTERIKCYEKKKVELLCVSILCAILWK